MIFYFSGTGNTRFLVERVSEKIHEEPVDIRQGLPASFQAIPTALPKRWGIAFPVYGWGVPPVVVDFIAQLPQQEGEETYVFAILSCGDEVGKSHEQLRILLQQKGYRLALVWSVQMPNTYVGFPFFDVDAPKTEAIKLAIAEQQCCRIAQAILRQESGVVEVEEGSFPRLRSTLLRRAFYRWWVSPQCFRTEHRCTGCGRCIKVCPMKNVKVPSPQEGPQWGSHCTFCMACYHVCPVQNIYVRPAGRKKGQTRRFL